MVNVPYKYSNEYWYWRPEPAYADADNNGTKDQTNANTGVYYQLPVELSVNNPAVIVRKQKLFEESQSGTRFLSKIHLSGYKQINLTFTGPVLDISLLYYLTDACTTTDNNPGAGQYTHTYTNSATHVNPPKSIELMHVVNNDTSAESFIELFTGVIVKSYNEKGGGLLDSAITGTWEMEGRNIISGTALTTPGYPAMSSLRAFRFADAVLTWTKGGVASDGYMLGYEFNWTSDKSTIKSGGYYPVNSLAPKSVKPMLTVQWLPQETDSYDDSQDDHTSAQVKIVSVKISRDTTLDYHSYAFVNAFQKLQDNPSWEAGNLVERHEFQMNPHESGSTFTIIEQNLFDDDRYET